METREQETGTEYRDKWDGEVKGDNGYYACESCDERLSYYTWESGSGLCPDCQE